MKLKIANGFLVDAVEYASRANAILGIRDSGKTYTATLIAEQMFDCTIPFFAFDPIGRWRFLRSPGAGRAGQGFPVVVVGGKVPDLAPPIEKYPDIIRAALSCGVSMVIDLYDVNLTKKAWREIVRTSIEVILYENESLGGLRHVFLEEAAEFVPQHVRDGNTYSVVEKLVRMGGNAGVGATIINQRAEEVNKAVLELCDNLLLHRQRGKNSLLSLRKWLEAGNVTPPKEITDSLADLPTGECWAWFKDVGKPRLIKVQPKRSFDPNRREMAGRGGKAVPRVSVAEFVEQMTHALEKKVRHRAPPAPPAPTKKEDPDVKESEAKALREENARLKKQIAQLEEIRKVQVAPVATSDVRFETGIDVDAIYAEIKARAAADPGLLALLRAKPEIEITVQRRKIEMSGDTLNGRVAILISEGFFDQGATGNAAFEELKRRGASVAKPSVYRSCDQLAEQGFLTKETNGYKSVSGMKVHIIEAA
jgi:hypothetical protein